MDFNTWNAMDEVKKQKFIDEYNENKELDMICEYCGADMLKKIEVISPTTKQKIKVLNIGKVIHPRKEELPKKLPYQICRLCNRKIRIRENRWNVNTKYSRVIE